MDNLRELCYDLDDMRSVEIITSSSKETKKLGFVLAFTLEKEPINSKQALVIALKGDLGSGKTTFIQGLARGLKVKENILSPTFVILKEFPINFSAQGRPTSGWKNLYHIDAYRLKNSEELLELGFKDLIRNPENLIVIEWADKVRKILPKEILKIEFENLGKNKRKIIICL